VQSGHVRSIQSTENAHDKPNLSPRAIRTRASGSYSHGGFGTGVPVGVGAAYVVPGGRLCKVAGCRAVRGNTGSAGRVVDGASVVALSATEKSYVFSDSIDNFERRGYRTDRAGSPNLNEYREDAAESRLRRPPARLIGHPR
jgi:hypothetical protein